jgi:hypothetical protein
MRNIGNDKCSVVRYLALDANTLSAWTVGIENGLCVHAHVNLAVLHFHQAKLLSLCSIDIVNEAICPSVLVSMDL